MKSKGFTLIELLVVVAIIGILATVVLSSLSSARSRARDAKREQDIKTIQNQLELYYVENGTYPTTGWRHSNDWTSSGTHSGSGTWESLETILGTTLPRDPTNETGASASNGSTLTYSYFSANNSNWCYGKAYMLVYNKENSNGDGPEDGVTQCAGPVTYGDAFVTGMSPVQ